MAKKNGQVFGLRTSSDRRRGTVQVSHDSAPVASLPAAAQPSWEDVARKAYEIFLSRGGVDGRDVEDWLAAERELRRQQ